MKILYLNHNFKGEGTFFRAFNFAKKIASMGHDITVMSISNEKKFGMKKYKESGVTIIETPSFFDRDGGGWAFLDTWSRIFHVIGSKYDIVHGFDHKPNVYFPLLASKLFHPKTIILSDWADWWMRGGIAAGSSWKRKLTLDLVETFTEEDVRHRAKGLSVTSKTLEKRALSIGVKKEKIYYIPSGCDIDRIKPQSKSRIAAVKRKFKIDPEKYIMEFIGFGQADLGILLDGFFELKKTGKNVLFIIVGPLEKQHEKKVNESPYKKDIIISGKVPFSKVAEYAAVADVYLMPLGDNPANRGRGPIKAGDYMAGGRPVIANNIGDVGYWIKKYKIGLLAKYDGKDIAKQVLYLMKNKKKAAQMGKNARATAEKFLSWEKVSGKMEKMYLKVKNKK